MDLTDAVNERISIRAFKPDPVSLNVLEEILAGALRAPSWGNTQPWYLAAVGGETLTTILSKTSERVAGGVPPQPEIPFPSNWTAAQKQRYKQVGISLFQALGIGREDKEKKDEYFESMRNLFGAPRLIYACTNRPCSPYNLLDVGAILQTIALLAADRGLGTCLLSKSVLYPDIIREHVDIPEDRTIVVGMAVGYPVEDHPANTFRSTRGNLDEFVTWTDV